MAQRAKLERALLLARELKRRRPWRPLEGPQSMAYNSTADVIGYGGSAGGGKTDLLAGLALNKHKRVLIIRREKAQTEGIIQRLTEIIGNTDGFNSQKAIWKVGLGTQPLIEFGGLDNLGDERRWQGRPHDLKAFDEATEMRESQVRFIMGWTRTDDPSLHPQVLLTFNPPTTAEGRWVIKFFAPWLDKNHPNPAEAGEIRWFTTIGDNHDAEVPDGRPFVIGEDGEYIYDFDSSEYSPEQILKPKSRTFIPARVTDNKYYMESGYMSVLQSLPEPLRSQMLYGDFGAGIEEDPWQVIPTAWVEAAMARWKRPDVLPSMDSVGVDVARGGKDFTDIARRHGNWFDVPLSYAGSETPDGPTVAGLVVAARRDEAPIHIDVIGVGSSPYDFLNSMGAQTIGVNVSEKATANAQDGRMQFFNLRTQLWWQMREALDPANNMGIALPPDEQLKADLTAPNWSMSGARVKVESRDEILKRIGRSPDRGTAYILALMDTPKSAAIREKYSGSKNVRRTYDPYA